VVRVETGYGNLVFVLKKVNLTRNPGIVFKIVEANNKQGFHFPLNGLISGKILRTAEFDLPIVPPGKLISG
jgi:hypothetical protein